MTALAPKIIRGMSKTPCFMLHVLRKQWPYLYNVFSDIVFLL